MRHKPKYDYSGLTIVLSNPSRNDKVELISGHAGHYFNERCLQPSVDRSQCDIRLSDTIDEGLLPGTKGILLLGERSFQEWTGGKLYKNYILHEQRGYPLSCSLNSSIPCIASYIPQDCVDIKDHESRLNLLLNSEHEHFETSTDSGDEKRRHGKTARSNWKFWLLQDTRKIISCLEESRRGMGLYGTESLYGKISYNLFPSSKDVIELLRSTKDKDLFLDIETDPEWNITVFGFSFGNSPIVYVVPLLRYHYAPAYGSSTPFILKALSQAMVSNTVVCHNAMFDLLILAWKYHIPVGRNIFDTMVAHHRCFPGMEKSLGHCCSIWTTDTYHKDEGIFNPHNSEQEQALWQYNGRDVAAMKKIKPAIEDYARRIPGLIDSIAQGNSSIRPYLISTLQGIEYDEQARLKIVKDNDIIMTGLLRTIRMLTGDEAWKYYSKGSDKALPSSNPQCAKYFHDLLGYKVVKHSAKTGKPSLDEKSILKLRIKHHENPVLELILSFRERAKESSTLGFVPWKT